MNCDVCTLRYDSSERIPLVLPCGHTICMKCVDMIEDKCHTCRRSISEWRQKCGVEGGYTKNYSILSMIDNKENGNDGGLDDEIREYIDSIKGEIEEMKKRTENSKNQKIELFEGSGWKDWQIESKNSLSKILKLAKDDLESYYKYALKKMEDMKDCWMKDIENYERSTIEYIDEDYDIQTLKNKYDSIISDISRIDAKFYQRYKVRNGARSKEFELDIKQLNEEADANANKIGYYLPSLKIDVKKLISLGLNLDYIVKNEVVLSHEIDRKTKLLEYNKF